MAGETALDARRGLESIVVAVLRRGVVWWPGFMMVLVAGCWVDGVEWLLAWASVYEGCIWWDGVVEVRVHGGRTGHREQL